MTDLAAPPHLSPTAQRLMRGHKPGVPAYLSWALGPPKGPAGLDPIDDAYAELVAAGLVEPADATLSVLPGVTRSPFVLTPAGVRARS